MQKCLNLFFFFAVLSTVCFVIEGTVKRRKQSAKHKKKKLEEKKKLVKDDFKDRQDEIKKAIEKARELGYINSQNADQKFVLPSSDSAQKTLLNLKTADQKPLETADQKPLETTTLGEGMFSGFLAPVKDIPENSNIMLFGSDQGFDSILLAKRAMKKGKIINVFSNALDLDVAEKNIKKYTADNNIENIEFCLWNIQRNLPIASESIDVCIINLARKLIADKNKAIREAFRILRHRGVLYLVDYVKTEKQPIHYDNQLSEMIFSLDDNKKIVNSYCKISALKNDKTLKKFKNYWF